MKYHMIAFFSGFMLDYFLGDPHSFPHPIRLMGRLIALLERTFLGRPGDVDRESLRNEIRERRQGRLLAAAVLAVTGISSAAILSATYALHPAVGIAVEAVMTYQILAARCLQVESMKVYRCLEAGDLPAARTAVSMIVGRDTQILDEEGVAKAAIETVAENTSDGVIAPMLYAAAGGPVLGFLYKAVNTMDSMVGYENDRYLHFGRAAAKLDDAVNYIPARVSAFLMIAAAFLGGEKIDGHRAFSIYCRDKRNHKSPNSAQTEAACAGALGIRLAGDASYFGKVVQKPYIGDAGRPVEYEDIRRANGLMYRTAWLCLALCLFVMAGLARILGGVG